MTTIPTAGSGSFASLCRLTIIAALALMAGCARLPEIPATTIRPETVGKLERHLLDHSPDMDQFRLRGPFEVSVREDLDIVLGSGELVRGDLYLSAPRDRAPLVILLHGHDNSRADHAYQAYHLASWGLHSLAIDLPNQGPWVDNGKTLARLVAHIRGSPVSVDARIDPQRIVLAGHSFGGAAVAVALADGAPVSGGILLDPASEFRELPRYLGQIRRPVLILSADARINTTQNRDDFFYFIPSNVFEVSVSDAHHEDAEFPYDSGLGLFDGTHASRPHQITFAAALVSGAFSIGFTGKLEYAWDSFAEAVAAGKLLDRMRK